MKTGHLLTANATRHIAGITAMLSLLLLQAACTGKSQDITDLVAHFQQGGFEAVPLDHDRQVKFENETGTLLYLHEAQIFKGISKGITQSNYLIESIPVTLVLFDDTETATRIFNLLKERHLNDERVASRLEAYPEFSEQLPVSFSPVQNGRFLIVIYHAKIDENGRLRARLAKNHVMIGLIKESFISYQEK